jgi:hypothetical protein
MLVSHFEGIKMLEEEYFNEFYTKISYLRNSMINLGKKISAAKLIKKILRSLPKRFRIKITTIKESKDLDNMRIEELVGSLQTYEFSLPPLRKHHGEGNILETLLLKKVSFSYRLSRRSVDTIRKPKLETQCTIRVGTLQWTVESVSQGPDGPTNVKVSSSRSGRGSDSPTDLKSVSFCSLRVWTNMQ